MSIEKRQGKQGVKWRVVAYDSTLGHNISVGTFAHYEDAKAADRVAGAKSDPRNTKNVTVRELATVWLDACNARPSTVRDYTVSMNRICKIVGKVKVRRLQAADIDGALRLMLQSCSPATVHKTLEQTRRMLRFGVQRGYLLESPAEHKFSIPTVMTTRPRALAAREVVAIADAVGEHYCTAVRTASQTGMRAAELWGVRVSDFDLQHGVVTLRTQLAYGEDGKPVLDELKTPMARRTIPLQPPLVEELRGWFKRVPRSAWGLAFPGPFGKPVRHNNFLRRQWNPACEALGIDAHFHDLRHTFASVLVSSRKSEKVIQSLMGHEDIATTLRVYAHVQDGEQAEAMEAIGDFFNLVTKSSPRESHLPS